MLVKKCDRCGRTYDKPVAVKVDGHEITGIRTVKAINLGSDNVVEYYDLCPDCLDSFGSWLTAPKAGETDVEK